MVTPLQVAVGLKSFGAAQLLCCWGAHPVDVITEFTYNNAKMTCKSQGVSDKDVLLWQVRLCTMVYISK